MSSCLSYENPLQRHFPEARAWTDWPLPKDSVTQLSTSPSWGTDRVAEQGDLIGTISSTPVFGTERAEGLTEFASSIFEHKGVCDDWYVGDGQVLLRLAIFDS